MPSRRSSGADFWRKQQRRRFWRGGGEIHQRRSSDALFPISGHAAAGKDPRSWRLRHRQQKKEKKGKTTTTKQTTVIWEVAAAAARQFCSSSTAVFRLSGSSQGPRCSHPGAAAAATLAEAAAKDFSAPSRLSWQAEPVGSGIAAM